jgi:1,4-dihydroxy-2-naphthoyl-CoA hydrolase
MFTIDFSVRLPDTDAAGILFFGNYFRLAHDAYEAFMESIGFSLRHIIREADFLVLIAHAEADYEKPLRLGDKVTVELVIESVRQTSFVLSYSLKDAQNDVAAKVQTVHVTVEKKSGDKIPLPEMLRTKLASAH